MKTSSIAYGIGICIICILCLVVYTKVEVPVEYFTGSQTSSEIKKTISLNFVGDILAARAVETTMRARGYDYPFLKVSNLLSSADITFANLETPLIGTATTGKTTIGGTTVFRGDIAFADAIKRAGIDIVSLANNHMKDQGEKGLLSTIQTLNTADVRHVGAGKHIGEARQLQVIETKGIKVGYLAYNDADVVPPSYHATEVQSGTHIMSQEQVREDVLAARSQVDILIISMHSGTEYVTTHPNSRQTAFAHAAIDAGADMVIGHHPHVLQPAELYKGKYIFYSLGNFIFDQPWPDTKDSVLLTLDVTVSTLSEKWIIDTIHPHITPLVIQNFQPQETTDENKKQHIFRTIFPQDMVWSLGEERLFVETARTAQAREMGLSHRKNMSKGTGLWFVFDEPGEHGIWMKDMNFPIDIYWFDKDLKLIDKRLSVNPDTYPNVFYPKTYAQYVLETSEGSLTEMSLTNTLTAQLTLLY